MDVRLFKINDYENRYWVKNKKLKLEIVNLDLVYLCLEIVLMIIW